MQKREKHITFFELKDALKKESCPICLLAEQSAKKYIDSLLYEKVNDAGIAKTLNESMGFCKEHSKLLVETGEALGIAIIYKRIVDHLIKHLKITLKPLNVKKCPACQIYSESEERYLNALYENWGEIKADLKALCANHFYMAIKLFKKNGKLHELKNFFVNYLEKISKELEEFSRKHDYLHKDEPWGKEKDSWKRAVRIIKN